MILDTEQNPKSPTLSASSSHNQSHILQADFRNLHGHVSYSTFPTSNVQVDARYTNNASDITALLGHNSLDPESPSDYEQPPTYESIDSKRASSRIWIRGGAIILVVCLISVIWASYAFGASKQNPNPPEHSPPDTSKSPPPITNPPVTVTSAPDAPTQIPLPPLPPYNNLPATPNSRYVLPDVGRTDLCRAWAYSLNSEARPSSSDGRPTDRLVYTIPSIAPIYIETSAICPTSGGLNKRCTEYDDSRDVISGKLNVIGGDVELPTVEIFLQHGSELGLEDLAVCLMQQPLSAEERVSKNKGHKWVLGIHIWKDPAAPIPNNLLASLSMTITLPYSRAHDLSTRINYFPQTIGLKNDTSLPLLRFGTLSLLSGNGHIEVSNVKAAVIEAYSEFDAVSVGDSKVTESLSLRSRYGIVGCNVTLAQTRSGLPIRANLESTAGVADAVVDLEYLSDSHKTPRFEVSAFSQFSRAMIWMTDHQGTQRMRTDIIPPVLPTIIMNLTSQFATAQAVIPATYHGSVDFNSESAAIRVIDEASRLPGRTIRWLAQTANSLRGNIWWAGRDKGEQGRIQVSTEFATVRALFLGADNEWRQKWPVPKERQG